MVLVKNPQNDLFIIANTFQTFRNLIRTELGIKQQQEKKLYCIVCTIISLSSMTMQYWIVVSVI